MAPWTPWMRLWLRVHHLHFVPLLLQMCFCLFVFFSFFVIFNQYVGHLLEVRRFAWMPSKILGRLSSMNSSSDLELLLMSLSEFKFWSSYFILSTVKVSFAWSTFAAFSLAWSNFAVFSLFGIHNTKCYCWNKLIVKSSIKFFQFVLVSYILLGLLYLLNHNLSWMKIFTIPWKTKFRFQTKATQKMLFEYI